MRYRHIAAAFLGFLMTTTAAIAENVSVTKVTLATGGLAEVSGEMDAAGTRMTMALERSLVADVLRTLVVTGETNVRSVDLEAAEPVGERSVAGRLLAGDLSNPVTLLQSLIGEMVELRGGPNQLSGRLLGFMNVTVVGGQEEGNRPGLRIAVVTEDDRIAYATFVADAPLAIEGPTVAERMGAVVPALREKVDNSRRELAISLDGEGVAGFTFVIPTTVWRPSYRALLGEGGAVDLQGWATLENTTGLDWDDIELSLAVGTPVAYSQDVYSPLRVSRPNAPFEVGRTAEVEIVEPSVADTERMSAGVGIMSMATGVGNARARRRATAFAAPRAPAARLTTGGPAIASSAATIFPVAGTIDLAAGRTLTVPFLDGSEDAGRIAYIGQGKTEPMDALELAFDAEATVPGGLIAVYDTAGFVGDARFAGADGGEKTILPFARATDLNVRLTQNNDRRITTAEIVDGTFRIRREARRRIVLIAAADKPVTLVHDLSGTPGEVLSVDGGENARVETLGPGRFRVRVDLAEGTTRLDLSGERPVVDQYTVGNIPTAVVTEVLATGAIDDETRTRLVRLSEAAAEIAAIDREVRTIEADINDLRAANAADRETLEAIDVATPEGAVVRDRLVARTGELNDALESLRALRRSRLEAETALRNP
ncbi:MAG: hypothetical protein AAF318_10045 [Pseudomonadota bacterium]